MNHLDLTIQNISGNGAHTSLVQAAIIREVTQGTIPRRQNIQGTGRPPARDHPSRPDNPEIPRRGQGECSPPPHPSGLHRGLVRHHVGRPDGEARELPDRRRLVRIQPGREPGPVPGLTPWTHWHRPEPPCRERRGLWKQQSSGKHLPTIQIDPPSRTSTRARCRASPKLSGKTHPASPKSDALPLVHQTLTDAPNHGRPPAEDPDRLVESHQSGTEKPQRGRTTGSHNGNHSSGRR